MTEMQAIISLAVVVSFIVGFFAGGIICIKDDAKNRLETERRGVWSIKDRAYKLTLIGRDPR